MQAACFFDYTCGFSFRVWRWIEEQVRSAHPEVHVDWLGFSLKEVNRADGPSPFDATDEPGLSLLALALGAAAAEADFASYHAAAFQAFHASERRVERDDLLRAAGSAGVDRDAFWEDRARWIGEVAQSHDRAVSRWGVFGTPTLVLDDAAIYLKMVELPPTTEDGARLWEALETLVVSHPEFVEIKRPIPGHGSR